MSNRDKILTACGWMADAELPLIAERIVNHSANHIEELESLLKAARCPNRGCEDGYYRDAGGEPEPCRWCYEREAIINMEKAG